MASFADLPPRLRFDRSGRERIVLDPSGCWVWTGGSQSGQGYAQVRVDGQLHLAHRLVYALLVGPPPPLLHHECERPSCCNPSHMKPLDGRLAHSLEHVALVCRRGHPLTEGNTYHSATNGRRRCRTCRDAYMRDYRGKG